MRISTRTHGMMDYAVGLLLIVAPYVLGFADGGAAHRLPMLLGAGAILYSLLTRYELGVVGLIPMPVHLGLDVTSGALLAMSPWLFHFSHQVYAPHLIFGLLEIAAGVLTNPVPSADRRYTAARG